VRRAASTLVAAWLVLAACGSAGGPGGHPAATANSYLGRVLALARDLGPVDPAGEIPIRLQLRDPHAAERAAALDAITRPGSPSFGQYLDPQTFDRRYGPDAATLVAVEHWLRAAGFATQREPGLPSLSATASAASVDRAFGIQLRQYRSSTGLDFYAAAREPVVPAALSGLVTAIDPITSYYPPRITAAVPAGGLSPADVSLAYDIKPLRDQGIDGAGETVVIFGTDGHDQRDFDAFTQKFGLPPIQVSEAGPGAGAPPHAGGEEEMDVEVVHEIAPAAKLVLYRPKGMSLGAAATNLEAMVQDNPGAIQSHSWGACEQAFGKGGIDLFVSSTQKAAALGETIFVASGDSGGLDCAPGDWSQPPNRDWVGVSLPAASPYVTGVGGTRISVAQDGSWYDETAWVYAPSTAGSGGGVSQAIDLPPWQRAPGLPNTGGKRAVPDISGDSDPASGMALVVVGGWHQGGGTSQAAPMWAGITALMNEYLKKHGQKAVGFLDPALYAIASGHPPYEAFHDVTAGGNLVYPAGPGYDLATGLGTPDVWNLARDLETYQKDGGKI
jgi:kumamolisin